MAMAGNTPAPAQGPLASVRIAADAAKTGSELARTTRINGVSSGLVHVGRAPRPQGRAAMSAPGATKLARRARTRLTRAQSARQLISVAADQSDEFEGAGSGYETASAAKRLIPRHQAHAARTTRPGAATSASATSVPTGKTSDIAHARAPRSPSPNAPSLHRRRAMRRMAMAPARTPSAVPPLRAASALPATADSGAASAMSPLGALLSAAGGVKAGAVGVILTLIIVFGTLAIIPAAASASSASLSETEARICAFLRAKGLGDVQVAAIMGNMRAESGMDPARTEAGGTGIGLCQWSFGRASALRAFAESQGKPWTDLDVQLDFFWAHDEYHTDWSAAYRVSGGHANPSPAPGTLVRGSKRDFLATKDVDEATRQFCFGWERAGFPRIDQRIDAARQYLAAISNAGSGEDYAKAADRQKRVVDSAANTPWPGRGLCAYWVSNVFERAGVGSFSGHAETMFRWWCNLSSRSELKVGMIIAVDDSPTSTYGHVGIYIGDDKVMESVNSGVAATDLDRWIAYNGRGGLEAVRWGWLGGVPLT